MAYQNRFGSNNTFRVKFLLAVQMFEVFYFDKASVCRCLINKTPANRCLTKKHLSNSQISKNSQNAIV